MANLGVDHGIDFGADTEGDPSFRVFCGGWGFHDDLMCPHSLDRGITSLDLGDDGVVVVRVKPSAVANLATRFGVERRMVEDDFAFVAGRELLHAPAVVDYCQDFAVVGTSLAVAFKN